MDITEKNVKKWSTIGARPTLGLALNDIAKKNPKLMVLTADVSTSAGLDRYKRSFPDQFLDVGIAEQNMMGIATGLSKEGFDVVTTSFAPFQSMRCLEHIRVNQGYMNMPVVMVGLASGIYHSYLGNTHCCFEDVSILRSIPNLSVVTPADGAEIVKCIEAAVNYKNAVYIRLIEGKGLPVIYKEEFDFQIGRANVLKQGNDIAILANGMMVSEAMQVSEELEKKGITVKVVDFHTVKPLDYELIDSLMDYKLVVTIEEHNIIGGMGSAVAEYLITKKNPPRMMMFGINDFYPHAGNYESALQQCGLLPEQIVKKILSEGI